MRRMAEEDFVRLHTILREIHNILSGWEWRLTEFSPEGKAFCPLCRSQRSTVRWYHGQPIALLIEHAPDCVYRALAVLVHRHPSKQIWKDRNLIYAFRAERRARLAARDV